jgi:hypothetical protein
VTEAEWIVCTDPQKMLDFLRDKANNRKLRLFAVACCRRVWNLLHDKRSRKAVECSERFADGQIDKGELSSARKEMEKVVEKAWNLFAMRHRRGLPDKGRGVREAAIAAKFIASATGRAAELFYQMCHAARVATDAELQQPGSSSPKLVRCHLLREFFGNPLRPVTLDPAVLSWHNGTVVCLAQAAYDKRHMPEGTLDNSRLAVLADALEEAGCQDQDILGHCRSGSEHVRGCWVIDLLLGKN